MAIYIPIQIFYLEFTYTLGPFSCRGTPVMMSAASLGEGDGLWAALNAVAFLERLFS
jgi:hypothetical protein